MREKLMTDFQMEVERGWNVYKGVVNDMSNKPIESGRAAFDEICNIVHCCLSINSTTIYTYDHINLIHRLDTNYGELITQNLGDINEEQIDGMDHLNLSQSFVLDDGRSMPLVLYYKKKVMKNGDLITVVILCGDKMLSSFVHALLEKIMHIYVNEYYESSQKFEFKVKLREIIQNEEEKLLSLYKNYNYGTIYEDIEGQISDVRDVLNESIDRVLQRGEGLDSLVNKTAILQNSSRTFKRNTVAVRRGMMWANVRFWLIIFVAVVVVIYFILGLECGLPFYEHCIHPSKPSQPTSLIE